MNGQATMHRSGNMSIVVRTVCGWIKGFILLYGIHIILYGHLTPGGGFSGGVVAASAFVLIMLAEGGQVADRTVSANAASTWDSLGSLLFWLMAILGFIVAGVFFLNFLSTPASARFALLSGGIIPPCNIGIGLKVSCSLYLVVLVLVSLDSGLSRNDDGPVRSFTDPGGDGHADQGKEPPR